MARRKQSTAEDIMDITASFPWWVGIGLAVVSYFGLHYVAGLEVKPMADMEQMSGFVGKQFVISMAGILQYALPLIFCFGALGSVILGWRKSRLYKHVKDNPKTSSLMDMSWLEFELLVGKYFESKGYAVRQKLAEGADGGVDLTVYKDTEKYLVQCKQWRSTKVGVNVVRELLGSIAARGAVGGFVVTAGEYTQPAKDFVKGRNIQLIDGKVLVNSVNTADIPEITLQSETNAPACPLCGSEMVIRTARRGTNAGNQFLGCSTFPKCKGVRNIQ